MGIRERLSGNEAVAFAMKQINPDVMGAFPITPSTEIPQYFAQYVANGLVDTEYVTENYAIGVNKDNTALLDAINQALAELTADGTIQSIVDKYITAE